MSINFVKSNKVFNENRTFVFDYVDLKDADINVFVNGIESNDFKILYSENLRFELPVDNKSKYLIKITFKNEDRFNEIKDNLKRILYSIDVTAKDKYGLYDQILKNLKNIAEITKAIKESEALNKSQKIRLLEVSMSIE